MKKEKKRDNVYFVEDIYVLTTKILPSLNDGTGNGPLATKTFYFVALKGEEDNFYELFSDIKIAKGPIETFDKPYIFKIEPFKVYLEEETKMVDKTALFNFIMMMNLNIHLQD